MSLSACVSSSGPRGKPVNQAAVDAEVLIYRAEASSQFSRGQHDSAFRTMNEAIDVARIAQDWATEAELRLDVARMLVEVGRIEQAEEDLHILIRIGVVRRRLVDTAGARLALARIADRRGDRQTATSLYEDAILDYEAAGAMNSAVKASREQARRFELIDPPHAEAILILAYGSTADDPKLARVRAQTAVQLAELKMAERDWGAAQRYLSEAQTAQAALPEDDLFAGLIQSEIDDARLPMAIGRGDLERADRMIAEKVVDIDRQDGLTGSGKARLFSDLAAEVAEYGFIAGARTISDRATRIADSETSREQREASGTIDPEAGLYDGRAFLVHGVLNATLDEHKAAIAAFDRALALMPKQAVPHTFSVFGTVVSPPWQSTTDVLIARAESLLATGNADAAIADLTAAIELAKRHEHLRRLTKARTVLAAATRNNALAQELAAESIARIAAKQTLSPSIESDVLVGAADMIASTEPEVAVNLANAAIDVSGTNTSQRIAAHRLLARLLAADDPERAKTHTAAADQAQALVDERLRRPIPITWAGPVS